MTQPKTALITGASSGIGRAFAQILAEQNYNLVLTARREQALQELADELLVKNKVKVIILPADLSQVAAPENIYNFCQDNNLTIDILVNNAGYGLTEPFHELSWETHQAFIHVLLTSLVQLTYLFLPKMIENKFGRIINVASIVGLIPGGGMYSAMKAAVIKFSEGLHQEYTDNNVYCCAVCPGATRTEFHNHMPHLKKAIPNMMWMESSTVALQAIKASMSGKSFLVNGLRNKVLVFFANLLPRVVSQFLFRSLRKVKL